MVNKLRIFLCTAFVIISSSLAGRCPNLYGKTIKEIRYEKLQGEWFLVASKPKLSEKCKNATISISIDGSYIFHEEFFGKKFHLWHKRSKIDYEILIPLIPSPIIELKKKSWYSIGSKKYAVIFADYEKFLVLFKCSKGPFSTSENVRIYSRTDSEYKAEILLKEIKDALAKFKISAVDLFYRTPDDCNNE